MSADFDVARCDCGAALQPPHPCRCTYGPALVLYSKPWRVVREGVPQMPAAGMPFAAEMFARTYAEAYGGELFDPAGRLVGWYPVPEWIREIERKAKALATVRAQNQAARPGLRRAMEAA